METPEFSCSIYCYCITLPSQLSSFLLCCSHGTTAVAHQVIPFATTAEGACVRVCVLHMNPFFLPIDIQQNQCPCRLSNPREIQEMWSQNYATEILRVRVHVMIPDVL